MRARAETWLPVSRRLFTIALALTIGLAGSHPLRPVELEEAPGWRPDAFAACREDPCRFQGRSAGDAYSVEKGRLERTSAGALLYERELAGPSERIVLAGISPASNQIVVAIARERVSVRGRSSVFRSPTVHPGDVERAHRLEVLNPKSGESIKSISLGPFRPLDLAISEHGEYVLLAGDDLHLDRREVRVYNTRSGRLEIQETVPKHADVVLASDGLLVGDRPLRLSGGTAGGKQRFNSRDPYSIAEYVVDCATRLDPDGAPDATFAVVKFDGIDAEIDRMLASALTLELQGHGLKVAEREQLGIVMDELWLQATGATDEAGALELGKLANVRFLIFGSLREAGTTSSLAVRAVDVADGEVAAGCEVTCRDCRRDDYLEALKFLVSSWAGGGGEP